MASRVRQLTAGMAERGTNLALLGLVVLSTVTGALNFALGTGWVAWPTVLHGVVGLAVVLVSWWKVRIARRGLARRPASSTWPSVLLGSAGAVWASLEAVVDVAGLPGERRRATGSFEEGSRDPARMPSIIWLFDPRLDLAADDWRLTVANGGRRTLGLDELEGHDTVVTAVIDCTQPAGAFGDRVQPTPSARRPGQPAAGDRLRGPAARPTPRFPARLVAPGRRGFWWVKWVTHVEVSEVPWWRQSPYPTQ